MIKVPLSEVDIFLQFDGRRLVRFVRRVHSPYLFYTTFHWLTDEQFFYLNNRLRLKYGPSKKRRLMSGTLLLTWECDHA